MDTISCTCWLTGTDSAVISVIKATDLKRTITCRIDDKFYALGKTVGELAVDTKVNYASCWSKYQPTGKCLRYRKQQFIRLNKPEWRIFVCICSRIET